jgi:putative PIN family toxin of toxin-antitoxin system
MRVVFDINVYLKNIFDEQATWPDIEPLPPASENAAADCLSVAFDGVGIELFVSPHILENVVRLMAQAGHTEAFTATYLEALLDIVEMSGGAVLDPPQQDHGIGDHEDNLILDLILAADADVLVTDDTDLTALNPWNGRVILRPYEFVNRWLQSARHQR